MSASDRKAMKEEDVRDFIWAYGTPYNWYVDSDCNIDYAVSNSDGDSKAMDMARMLEYVRYLWDKENERQIAAKRKAQLVEDMRLYCDDVLDSETYASSMKIAAAAQALWTQSVGRLGQKCTRCKLGSYAETSIHDDWEGTLHCTRCRFQVRDGGQANNYADEQAYGYSDSDFGASG